MHSLKEWDRLMLSWDAHRDRTERQTQAATIFFDVIRRNDWESAMRLLGRGASPNWVRDGFSPILIAARHGAMESVKLLLTAGASLGSVDGEGRDALWHALLNRQDPMLDLLIAKGAEIDRRATVEQRSPLIQAAADGNFYAARALVRANCAVNARDIRGQNALHHCLKKEAPTADDVAIARLLLENGGEPRAVDLAGKRAVDIVSDPAYVAALEAQSIAVEIQQVRDAQVAQNPTPATQKPKASAPARRKGMRL